MNQNITDKQLKQKVLDALCKNNTQEIKCSDNLFLRVYPSGGMSFLFRSKINGKNVSKTIGKYPEMSLKDARTRVIDVLYEIKNVEKQSSENSAPLFGDYSKQWVETYRVYKGIPSNYKNNKSYYTNRALVKHLEGLFLYKLDDIKPLIVKEILEKVNCTIGTKRRAINTLNRILNSAVVDGIIEINYCQNMLNSQGIVSKSFPAPKSVGYSWCPANELKDRFFKKLENVDDMQKVFYIFIAMSGLRVGSASRLTWENINFSEKKIYIPASDMKMDRDFILPLTPFLESLFSNWKKQCLSIGIDSKYVFYKKTKNQEPINQARMNEPVTTNLHGDVTLHGLRKTLKTWLSEIGISDRVSECCLSHLSTNNLENVYNKYDYFKERSNALNLWNYYLFSTQLTEKYKSLIDVNSNVLNVLERALEDRYSLTKQIEFDEMLG